MWNVGLTLFVFLRAQQDNLPKPDEPEPAPAAQVPVAA